MNQTRKIEIIEDYDGTKIVKINEIQFKGRQKTDWKQVKDYLKEFVGKSFLIDETSEMVFIGTDFPDEYKGSKYTSSLYGTLAKAKANGAQGIPEMIKIASNKSIDIDYDKRHGEKAEYGWYRYDTRFALPVYSDDEEVERYNVFKVRMLVRHDADGKRYLYDMEI